MGQGQRSPAWTPPLCPLRFRSCGNGWRQRRRRRIASPHEASWHRGSDEKNKHLSRNSFRISCMHRSPEDYLDRVRGRRGQTGHFCGSFLFCLKRLFSGIDGPQTNTSTVFISFKQTLSLWGSVDSLSLVLFLLMFEPLSFQLS